MRGGRFVPHVFNLNSVCRMEDEGEGEGLQPSTRDGPTQRWQRINWCTPPSRDGPLMRCIKIRRSLCHMLVPFISCTLLSKMNHKKNRKSPSLSLPLSLPLPLSQLLNRMSVSLWYFWLSFFCPYIWITWQHGIIILEVHVNMRYNSQCLMSHCSNTNNMKKQQLEPTLSSVLGTIKAFTSPCYSCTEFYHFCNSYTIIIVITLRFGLPGVILQRGTSTVYLLSFSLQT